MQIPLYSRPFLLLCLSHALFAGSFNMMIPELPAYLTSLGGSEHKGLIIALFTLSAGLSRPFSGKLADTIGRMPVMYIGVLACVVCSLAYPLLAFVAGFLWLRLLHGFSTGFKPTGSAAYVADMVPSHRLGEAMGIMGICLNVGASSAPLLGSWLVQVHSTTAMFIASALLAALSMLILVRMPETLTHKRRFEPALLKIDRHDIIDPKAFPAGWVMLFCYWSYGVLLTLTPDLSDHVGVPNRAAFFAIFTLSSLATRFTAGRVSDRLGRVPVLKASTFLMAGSMIVFANAQTPLHLYMASALFGLGNGIFSPAINAWTIDLGEEGRKGRALATMFIALELAIGSGAFLSGWYFANDFSRLPAVFYAAAAMTMGGWVYLTFYTRKKSVHQPLM
jgi:MFS family permease